MKCPKCGSEDSTMLVDCGIEMIIRALLLNNQYVCLDCSVTWLRKRPQDFQKLKNGRKSEGTLREVP